MADRYVRVKTDTESVHYGLLELNQSVQLLSQAPWRGGQPTGKVLAPDTYTLLTPCEPTKIVAVGKNYIAHAAEMGGEVPPEPLIFLKPPTTLIAHEQKIVLPPQSAQVDYEGELALIIGSTCHNCTVKQSFSGIWGYTIANDVTARDLQRRDGQWTRAKGFDTFCPLGPWIVRDINPSALLQTFRNGDRTPLQSTTIDQMVFAPEVLVSYISRVMTLYPGDVILTGTPEGIGTIYAGDRICIEIEGIGKLHNSVISAPSFTEDITEIDIPED